MTCSGVKNSSYGLNTFLEFILCVGISFCNLHIYTTGVQGWRSGCSQGLECSQDFGVATRVLEYNVKIYPTCYEKSFKKGTLKPKTKNSFATPFLLSLFKYLRGRKKSQI